MIFKGYTLQEGSPNTVENYLFDAFQRTKLIQSRETSNYHRCGRTDRGIQKISLLVGMGAFIRLLVRFLIFL